SAPKARKGQQRKHNLLFPHRGRGLKHPGARLHRRARGEGQADGDRRPRRHADQVMSGQIDIGWAAPPFGMKELKEGKIRILIRGNEAPSLRGQTVRTIIGNADALKNKKDAILRFVAGYREAVDWMYADPKAIDMYAEKMKLDRDLIASLIKEFHPKEALQ